MSRRTAIIGAGLAGLTTAERLADAGEDVVLFEKARGPGGRIATRRSEHGHFDHGAQYFTVRDPRIARRVDDWIAAGVVAEWPGPFVTLRAGVHGPDPKGDATRYVGTPRMSAIARHLAADRDVRCGIRIASVEPAGGGWTLCAEDGQRFAGFEAVVVSVPPAQAVRLLSAQPAFARVASQARLDPCVAVLARFEKPLETGFAGAFVEDSPLAWIADQRTKPGRDERACVVLHATPAWSGTRLDTAPEDAARELLEALAVALDRTLPGVLSATVHRWRYAQPSPPRDEQRLWDPDSGLGVCGDWLCGARIESALVSGLALAEAMGAVGSAVGGAIGGGER